MYLALCLSLPLRLCASAPLHLCLSALCSPPRHATICHSAAALATIYHSATALAAPAALATLPPHSLLSLLSVYSLANPLVNRQNTLAKPTLDLAPKLVGIGVVGVGTDSIDLGECKDQRICVMSEWASGSAAGLGWVGLDWVGLCPF
jgi:hypothetical protein